MSVMDEFVKMAVEDIKGQPQPAVAPQAQASINEGGEDARSAFAKIAVADITGGTKPVSKEELEKAFHNSITDNIDRKSDSALIIEQFKESAGQESKDMLTKLLKGLK